MNKTFTILSILLFFFSFSPIQISAEVCEATFSGDWDDDAIWDCTHKPVAGDEVTIPAGITVTVRVSDDLSGGAPTFITVEGGGFLIFAPACNSNCKIDFSLADGSTIDIKGTDGTTVDPLAWASKVKVKIGNELVLHGSSGSNSFPFGPGLLPDGALPVELVTYSGFAMERSNILKWQTASEENTMAFIVERSADGVSDFKEINRINAFGNSTELRVYQTEDLNPVTLAYYRLRIVDFDGTFEFSDIIAVERVKTEIDLVEIFPIPAEEEVTILIHTQSDGRAVMVLSDFTGKKIKEEKIILKAGINRYTLDWEENENKLYFITIDNGVEKIAKKILRSSTN